MLTWHHSRFKRRQTRLSLDVVSKLNKSIALLPVELQGVVRQLAALPFTERIEHPTLDSEIRQRIVEHMADEIEQFRALSGRDHPRTASA